MENAQSTRYGLYWRGRARKMETAKKLMMTIEETRMLKMSTKDTMIVAMTVLTRTTQTMMDTMIWRI